MWPFLDVATSLLVSLVRGTAGLRVTELGPRPSEPLQLYEFEGCPFCRKVREVIAALDLDVIVYPCPKGGPRFREDVKRRGRKYQFPYLVDPNTGRAMYESNDIVNYLFEHYGAGRVPFSVRPGRLTTLTAALAGIFRPTRGVFYRGARAPELPLELFGYEASPGCRIVRECLTALEIPYRLYSVAWGSPRRRELRERTGSLRVPLLRDPNTGAELSGAEPIVRHLEHQYAMSHKEPWGQPKPTPAPPT